MVNIKKRIKRATAFFLSFIMTVSLTCPAFSDESVSVDVKDPQSSSSTIEAVQIQKPVESYSSSIPRPTVSAAVAAANQAVNEGNAAVSNAKDQKNKMESGLKQAQDIKQDLEQTRSEITGVVIELDSQMQDISMNIAEVEDLLSVKDNELKKTSAKLIESRQDAADQYESMKLRIKFMYEHGTDDLLGLLLGAASFSEFLNKAEYIKQISAYDRAMLIKYEETCDEMEELEKLIDQQKKVLEDTKKEVEKKKDELSTVMNEKAAELEKYNKDIADKEAAIAEYEAMIAEQDETILELEKAAEAAKKRQQQILAQETGVTVSGNSYNIQYGGGAFTWPAPSYTRISDDYGMRIHPILGVEQFHNGVDMAAPSGSPILAAADGYVVAASYSSTMGNYIMIDHGSGIYTIYMHASALYVSADSKVSRGDTIGAVGSTGRSTGSHLHFSVRVNGNYVSPWSYL